MLYEHKEDKNKNEKGSHGDVATRCSFLPPRIHSGVCRLSISNMSSPWCFMRTEILCSGLCSAMYYVPIQVPINFQLVQTFVMHKVRTLFMMTSGETSIIGDDKMRGVQWLCSAFLLLSYLPIKTT